MNTYYSGNLQPSNHTGSVTVFNNFYEQTVEESFAVAMEKSTQSSEYLESGRAVAKLPVAA